MLRFCQTAGSVLEDPTHAVPKSTSCANLPIQCDVLRLGKSRAEALLGSAPAGLGPYGAEASLGPVRSLGFALEVKQGVGVTGRSAACPDPTIAAEERA